MKMTSQTMVIFTVLFVLTVLGGCSDSSTDPANQEPKVGHPGFSAKVSGAVNAEVSGGGIVTYLPPREGGKMTGDRPGYFLIANLNSNTIGDRGVNMAFRIPDDAQPGNYTLMTQDPLNVGENFDVRVETVQEGKPMTYQMNTEGTINLDNFTPNHTYPDASIIKGTFQFVTENSEGDEVLINGAFDLPSAKKIVSQEPASSIQEVSNA